MRKTLNILSKIRKVCPQDWNHPPAETHANLFSVVFNELLVAGLKNMATFLESHLQVKVGVATQKRKITTHKKWPKLKTLVKLYIQDLMTVGAADEVDGSVRCTVSLCLCTAPERAQRSIHVGSHFETGPVLNFLF